MSALDERVAIFASIERIKHKTFSEQSKDGENAFPTLVFSGNLLVDASQI
jgi:hypothetical protein